MKTLLCCSAALILLTGSATAQNNPPVQPDALTDSARQKPPLQLSDESSQGRITSSGIIC
jgi:hypothetical protein